MKRRAVLAGVATMGLSGCIGPKTIGRMGTDDFSRELQIVDHHLHPEDIPVEIELATEPGIISEASTAYIHMTLTNSGSDALEIDSPFYKGWSAQLLDADQDGIAIYSEEAADFTQNDDPEAIARDCISGVDGKLNDRVKRQREWTAEGRPRYGLDPGETKTIEFIVMDDYTMEDSCFPDGEYLFSDARADGDSENQFVGQDHPAVPGIIEFADGSERKFGFEFSVRITS